MSTTCRLLIIIATYNEIENLPQLVKKLFELIDDLEIVVVDDNSPDGTGKWCHEQVQVNEHFHHIARSGKLGLGSATMAGLEFGRDHGFEFVATMDADLSHSPHSMAKMWKKTREVMNSESGSSLGAMIGSRYVAGGGIEGWPWHRRMASKVVNLFARAVLKLPTHDNTGAFRIYQTQALRKADVYSMTTTGFAYLEELLLMLHRSDFELHEFPITFSDRQKGHSKASFFEGVRVLQNIWRLRKTVKSKT